MLVEDNPGDARLIEETIGETDTTFEITHANRLSEARKLLRESEFHVILLDLLLPDGTGIDTFLRLVALVPDIPIIVLTGLNNENLAVRAVREGAQDYTVKGQLDGGSLVRSIRYAIERHRVQMTLRNMSHIDELTELYNRRGFLTMLEQHCKLAPGTEKGFLLVFAGLDYLKQINDIFGHNEGDMALINTAEILRKTFRDSDIIARIGGDEFVILLIEADNEDMDIITARLQKRLDDYNGNSNRPYKLSISTGIVPYEPQSRYSVDEILSQADTLMYTNKLAKKVKSRRGKG
ncbi:MAG TPA: GGDEF domain-containing response regulator [Thermodesulfobacteriota bacterium]|nr:GGDEF domain-containing response regulator [Thermodesulfobacteriota bacterium]